MPGKIRQSDISVIRLVAGFGGFFGRKVLQ